MNKFLSRLIALVRPSSKSPRSLPQCDDSFDEEQMEFLRNQQRVRIRLERLETLAHTRTARKRGEE